MRNAIRKAQRADQRTAKNVPFINVEFYAEGLNVIDQVPGRILTQFGVRRRTSRTTLVKENYLINGRVEKLPVHRDKAAARPPMKKNYGNSIRIAGPFVID